MVLAYIYWSCSERNILFSDDEKNINQDEASAFALDSLEEIEKDSIEAYVLDSLEELKKPKITIRTSTMDTTINVWDTLTFRFYVESNARAPAVFWKLNNVEDSTVILSNWSTSKRSFDINLPDTGKYILKMYAISEYNTYSSDTLFITINSVYPIDFDGKSVNFIPLKQGFVWKYRVYDYRFPYRGYKGFSENYHVNVRVLSKSVTSNNIVYDLEITSRPNTNIPYTSKSAASKNCKENTFECFFMGKNIDFQNLMDTFKDVTLFKTTETNTLKKGEKKYQIDFNSEIHNELITPLKINKSILKKISYTEDVGLVYAEIDFRGGPSDNGNGYAKYYLDTLCFKGECTSW